MDRFLPYFLLMITIPISLTFANPLPQWELSRADDMPSISGIETIEFLADFAAQNDNINLVDPYTDLPNHVISNNLMGDGIHSPFLVADKGFRVYNDPKDKRPVLEIETNPTKISPPNTPVGMCANTNPIGLCCDDHKDTTQPMRVACQPFDDGRSAACTKTNANIACCKRYIPESLVQDSYQSSTLMAMDWTTGGVGAGCGGSEKYPETNVPTNVGAPEPYPALRPQ